MSKAGDIHRFDAPNKLAAFAGLDVRVTQYGEFIGTRQEISKRGSPYLRKAVWLAASRAAFYAPVLSEYYQSLLARGKHHLTTICSVSRKLCNTIHTILKEERLWQPVPPRDKTCRIIPVSYTHLDVYKRQHLPCPHPARSPVARGADG